MTLVASVFAQFCIGAIDIDSISLEGHIGKMS
jgi:hypothetical protein